MLEELDKLGTVLAIQNAITKDTLDMLKEQQKRQVRMIWSSMAIVGMAIIVVGIAVYCTFSSLDKMTEQITNNREMILQQHGEMIDDATAPQESKGIHRQ